MAEADTDQTFKANVSSTDPNLKLSYKWTVSDGTTIISGQGKPSLVVRVRGGLTTTATVEVEGLAPGCANKASCSVVSCGLRISRLFDKYVKPSFNKEIARLKNFALQLQNEPDAQGYIIVYAGRNDDAGAAESHAARLKNYLIKEFDFEDERIVVVDGGAQKEMMVELYITPPGATPPAAHPDPAYSKMQ